MIDKKTPPIYTMDIETDPFLYGRLPMPFCIGLQSEDKFASFWGDDCIESMMAYLYQLPKGIIYMHNGGKFDIYYIWEAIKNDSEMMIINSRVLKCNLKVQYGGHEVRDSYAIMPFKLASYKKDAISYDKFEPGVRENYRHEITSYLRGDCQYLRELCVAFIAKFGDKLTVGSTAIEQLKQFHTFEKLNTAKDHEIREQFYYGGRVECFKKGVIDGKFKVYDVNSMYPYVMKNFQHPISAGYFIGNTISKFTCFVTVEGFSHGAFPSREKNRGLCFEKKYGVFNVTIHEYRCAIRLGLFDQKRVIRAYNFDTRDTFKGFVNHFYKSRIEAKNSGDTISALFYKFVLN